MAGGTASERLIAEIAGEGRFTGAATGRLEFDPRVLDALRRAPREAFVADGRAASAYASRPLPIGFGQTIPHP